MAGDREEFCSFVPSHCEGFVEAVEFRESESQGFDKFFSTCISAHLVMDQSWLLMEQRAGQAKAIPFGAAGCRVRTAGS